MNKVTVLLSTYNGEKYIEEQLDSLLAQQGVEVFVLVRDDGSTDNTTNILKKYENEGKLKWYTGENLHPAKSFMDLVMHAPESAYYAFCDQDDYWIDDKLIIAIQHLEKCDASVPALYYGSPRLVDVNLEPIPNPRKLLQNMTTYGSSLVNSNATGCTMVFNNALLKKLVEKQPDYIPMHDAWLHKVCLAVGGTVCFDKDVHILYRQHSNNVIGISNTKIGMIKSYLRKIRKRKNSGNKTVRSLYDCYENEMSEENKKLSLLAINYQNSLFDKLRLLFNSKIKTAYFSRNLLFRINVLMNLY